HHILLIICLLSAVASVAQPVWSPSVRAKREAQWMQDSLSPSPEQMQQVNPILLRYQQEMDKSFGDDKKQHALMMEKDHALKAILNKDQYKKYYRREE